MYTNSVIEPSMAEKFAKLEPRPSQYGWGSWDLMLTTFKAGLARGPWILGDRFSAADILMGTSARYMRQFGMLQHDDVLFAYADRCAERPAFRRALELEAQAVR